MKLSVFGAGYVGLVTAACFAEVGHSVVCCDIDQRKIDAIESGEIPFFEPGLSALVLSNVQQRRLKFTTSISDTVEFGQFLFIAVGTPPKEDGSADLSYVLGLATSIGESMSDYKVIVDKSTVPVGTADQVSEAVRAALQERRADIEFDVCSNPEFLKEGSAIEDFTKAARIIVGTESATVRSMMRECYAPYNRNHDKIMFMDVRSAELTKYAANAMLATKISFMNEIANLAERLGADVEAVRHGIGSDPRIGYQFIYPGCGYGGSCFPKDVKALIDTAKKTGYEPELLRAVDHVNTRQKQTLFTKLLNAFDGDLQDKTVAIWGLSFKPDTDDIREAPSLALIEALLGAGARVQGYDPEAMTNIRHQFQSVDGLSLSSDKESALVNADALVICTEWKQFRTIDFDWLKEQLTTPVIVDGRNLYDPSAVKAAGLLYFAVGRADSVVVGA